MTEPLIFGLPISLFFLYFIFYSFLGWAMETCFCSLLEKRFVARGFLYGPICPIYGVGVLMMICWFAPLKNNVLLFYLVATVCMSAWEYLVGWFLETTTHIKYWDYSMYKFNLHGRICLQICLTWGALAYVVVFLLHPPIAQLAASLPPSVLHLAAIALLVLLLADATATIHQLALVSRMMRALSETGEELRLQLTLGKAELSDYFAEAMESWDQRADGLRSKYEQLLRKAERASRHLRYAYSSMTSKHHPNALTAITEASRKYQAERKARKAKKTDP